jgi:hypothetical protein
MQTDPTTNPVADPSNQQLDDPGNTLAVTRRRPGHRPLVPGASAEEGESPGEKLPRR